MNKLNTQIDILLAKLAILPKRDKTALKALVVFFILMLLYSVIALHLYANKVEKSALNIEKQFFWMRGQAGNINTSSNPVDTDALIKEYANAQNITLNILEKNSHFTAGHENSTVLGGYLARLETSGIKFKKIDMQQQDDLTMLVDVRLQ